jgi:hypothetical protein
MVVLGLEIRPCDADSCANALAMIAMTLRTTLVENLLTASQRIRWRLRGKHRHKESREAGAEREPPVESPPEPGGHAI